jgi:VWA domain-containing protein
VTFTDGSGQAQEIKAPQARVIATWSADDRLTSRIDPAVAHYTGQEEIAQAIQQGLEASERGNAAEATRMLGRAVQLAHASGNTEMTSRLQRVVDIDDAPSGTVRIKRSVEKAAAMDLELESTTTKRARREPV